MEINIKDFKKEIKNSKIPVLVEFWGSWCLPCQMMESVLKELGEKYKGKVKILKINSDISPAVSLEYKIMGVPTFILFKEGKELKREVGAKSKEALLKMVDSFINKN